MPISIRINCAGKLILTVMLTHMLTHTHTHTHTHTPSTVNHINATFACKLSVQWKLCIMDTLGPEKCPDFPGHIV